MMAVWTVPQIRHSLPRRCSLPSARSASPTRRSSARSRAGANFRAGLLGENPGPPGRGGQIERGGGLRAEDLRAFIAAFGLRPPEAEERAFTPEEARVFVELGRLEDIWPPELDVRLLHVLGPLLPRGAHARLHAFR